MPGCRAALECGMAPAHPGGGEGQRIAHPSLFITSACHKFAAQTASPSLCYHPLGMARQLNIGVPEELYERLKAFSGSTGIPQARVVRDALENRLEGFEVGRVEYAPDYDSKPDRLEEARKVMGGLPEAPQLFKCPFRPCKYEAKSPAATCPEHGRRVVPV